MRIRILALSGALAASTLLAAPAMADEHHSHARPWPRRSPRRHRRRPGPRCRFRNSCKPQDRHPAGRGRGPARDLRARSRTKGVYIWHEKAGWRVRLTHTCRGST